ncbi:hypothetical protein V6N11_077754 [Hibiscus sabdariffa]|uniref:RRM domain-containing protein n=1 Tax=Hibiscus sabdariffa TaxID=183260 RepID=A0ABR2TEX6_9ROSI
MSQPRQFQMVGGNHPGQFNDTTFTKIFVGGLAWETQRDTMRRYFEQFGEILEAVVITDKNTGRSKGYGFVTFEDPESAMRACQNPSPIIDGRRSNCNLAALGAQKTRPPISQHGSGRFRPAPAPAPGPGLMAPPGYHGSSSAYIQKQQPAAQYSFPYSAYGYTGYSQEGIYPLNYYNLYGGQQFSPYYTAGASMTPGLFHNLYPLYAQNNQAHGFGAQYPQIVQYPYLPQQYNSTGMPSVPSSMSMAATTTGVAATTMETAAATTMTTTTTTATATTPPIAAAPTKISSPTTTTTIATTGVVGAKSKRAVAAQAQLPENSSLEVVVGKMSVVGEAACSYAALILYDDGIPITAEKIATLVKSANVSVESYWPSLFAKLFEKCNIGDLIINAGSAGAGAPVAVAAPDAANAGGGADAAPPPAEEKKKEEPEESSDEDMGFGLFD